MLQCFLFLRVKDNHYRNPVAANVGFVSKAHRAGGTLRGGAGGGDDAEMEKERAGRGGGAAGLRPASGAEERGHAEESDAAASALTQR